MLIEKSHLLTCLGCVLVTLLFAIQAVAWQLIPDTKTYRFFDLDLNRVCYFDDQDSTDSMDCLSRTTINNPKAMHVETFSHVLTVTSTGLSKVIDFDEEVICYYLNKTLKKMTCLKMKPRIFERKKPNNINIEITRINGVFRAFDLEENVVCYYSSKGKASLSCFYRSQNTNPEAMNAENFKEEEQISVNNLSRFIDHSENAVCYLYARAGKPMVCLNNSSRVLSSQPISEFESRDWESFPDTNTFRMFDYKYQVSCMISTSGEISFDCSHRKSTEDDKSLNFSSWIVWNKFMGMNMFRLVDQSGGQTCYYSHLGSNPMSCSTNPPSEFH